MMPQSRVLFASLFQNPQIFRESSRIAWKLPIREQLRPMFCNAKPQYSRGKTMFPGVCRTGDDVSTEGA